MNTIGSTNTGKSHKYLHRKAPVDLKTSRDFFSRHREILEPLLQRASTHMILTPEIPEIPYEVNDLVRFTAHIGQLKLLLSEISFLTLLHKAGKMPDIVIYAGSA